MPTNMFMSQDKLFFIKCHEAYVFGFAYVVDPSLYTRSYLAMCAMLMGPLMFWYNGRYLSGVNYIWNQETRSSFILQLHSHG